MPRLGSYRDNDELDNAIADKIIVYVEGPDDESFFRALAGPNIADRLEFKIPETGTGYHEVKKRVTELRPDNPKVHGLLDGEAAVSFGQSEAFLTAADNLFRVDLVDFDGLLFLPHYELENILIRHAKLARFIVNNVPVGQLGTRKIEEVQRTLHEFVPRFYLFSLIKFAMIKMHRPDRPCKGIGAIGGRFLDKNAGWASIMRNDVQPKISEQVEWDEFLAELKKLGQEAHERNVARGLDTAGKLDESLRIADGKLMLKHVKSRYGGDGRWDGHLHDNLVNSGYGERFNIALLAATQRVPENVAA